MRHLKASRGRIVNIASVVAHKGYAQQSVYAASKHALLGLSKSLANEVYKDGVRVHVISPGGVYTDMVKIARPDLAPEGLVVPQEIAQTVMFLLRMEGNAVIDEICVRREGKPPFAEKSLPILAESAQRCKKTPTRALLILNAHLYNECINRKGRVP